MESNNFQTGNTNTNTEQEEISIIDILFHYLRYWKWFLLSVVICVGVAGAYLYYATPQYKILSRIVISDEKKGPIIDVSPAFTDLGITPPKNNVDNEIEILRSRTLMKEVVDSLKIGVSYFKKDGIKSREIYKKTPIYVTIPNVMTPGGAFTLDLVGDKSNNVLSIRSNEGDFHEEVALEQKVTQVVLVNGTKNDTISKTVIGKDSINSPWGMLSLSVNPFGSELYPIEVVIKDPKGINFLPKVDINSVNKTSSVVELSYITATPEKGQDIVNTLVARYNKNAIDDKNYVAYSTMAFIDERLKTVTGELSEAENTLTKFNLDMGFAGKEAIEANLIGISGDYSKQITAQGIQLDLLKSTKDYLMNPATKDNAAPANIGLNDPTIIDLMKKYNDEVLVKKQETAGMSENHPALKEFNNRVASLRDDLIKGITISEAGAKSTIRELERRDGLLIGKAKTLTSKEHESRGMYRQQNLKESLFTYLMQKREDTGLSLMMATPNAKIIDVGFNDPAPVKPKKMIILLAALLLAVILPVIVIYIKDLFDNKVHTKEDVTRTITAPFLGIIPVMKVNEPFPVLRTRSAMAERFRTIISNLEFIVGSERRKIISVTSYTSGDGKSFFSRNLAMTLATTGKKTLLIDLDLRKSVMVKTLGSINTDKGSATFLSDPNIKINEIIDTSHTFHRNLDIIPVHVFPPNPAELLSSERLEQLFQAIGRDYDYIVVDTAPVGLVADVYNINAYALSTIFLLRSDYTLKRILPEIQELYSSKKFNNLSIVLNAVSDDNIYGYGYGYGKYGHYKHNYYTDPE